MQITTWKHRLCTAVFLFLFLHHELWSGIRYTSGFNWFLLCKIKQCGASLAAYLCSFPYGVRSFATIGWFINLLHLGLRPHHTCRYPLAVCSLWYLEETYMWHRFGGWCCNGCAKGLGVSQALSDCRWMDPWAAHTQTHTQAELGLHWPGLSYLGFTARLSWAARPSLNQKSRLQ